jgi:pimeloyl-ACP methyl ester carboxylesterase
LWKRSYLNYSKYIAMAAPLLSIQKFCLDNLPFPGYFVASTAPINIEDQPVDDIPECPDPKNLIDEISQYLQEHKGEAEILIVIHGYNTSKEGAKDWFESIYQYLAKHYDKSRSKGLLFIGYRWPSEQTSPLSSEVHEEGGSFKDKLKSAKGALPVVWGKIARFGGLGFVGSIIASVASVVQISLQDSNAAISLTIFAILAIFSLIAVSPILTIIVFRLGGYFRDSYRASNFGVSDLVELIRHIDHALIQVGSYNDSDRIKLSFIGHSMGGFVVTDTVRILSDVFDPRSIGSLDITSQEKKPSPFIGNVFSLGRLVLVSPDIPAETIISGRANFLQSSLRRFQEAYLFSNEGDMALRLGSTTTNYFSYPSKTQDGGYRLGNVTFRNSTQEEKTLREGVTVSPESYGMMARLANDQLVSLKDGQEIPRIGYPLDYLYIRKQIPLSQRQKDIALAPSQKPIGELFTFFDCTDYAEKYLDKNKQEKTAGLVSRALRKQALTFGDYTSLAIDYFTGKIDTHWGYFSNGEAGLKPEATFTKLAIYGLACVGFEKFLFELQEDPIFDRYKESFEKILNNLKSQRSDLKAKDQEILALNQILSSICRDKGIQVLLAQERYALDIGNIPVSKMPTG